MPYVDLTEKISIKKSYDGKLIDPTTGLRGKLLYLLNGGSSGVSLNPRIKKILAELLKGPFIEKDRIDVNAEPPIVEFRGQTPIKKQIEAAREIINIGQENNIKSLSIKLTDEAGVAICNEFKEWPFKLEIVRYNDFIFKMNFNKP